MPNPNAKACLLSGPPGIGKSTAAKLIANELGYQILETNASDQRNKKLIEELLTDTTKNETILYYTNEHINKNLQIGERTVIIMDEVDGISGNNDRGGMPALIKIIKNSRIPIICICNDRQNQKIRSLASHCYDLKFSRYK